MKRVLYLAYFFPPLGGAGVQRSLKFVRYLPENGWMPHVLTGPVNYWIRDETLLAELDPQIQVDRVEHLGSRWLGGGGGGTRRSDRRVQVLRSISRMLLVPDAYIGWSRAAAERGKRVASANRFDAIVTTSSPDSAHLAGARLQRTLGIPWVADFRDPWTRRLAYAPPTPLHHRWHRRLERGVLLRADRVIVTSEATRSDFLARTDGLDPDRVTVIPNGYDESDFAAARLWIANRPRPATSGRLDAAVAGAAPAAAGVPGARIPIAPWTGSPAILHAGQLNPERPIDPYLRGLRHLLERSPGVAAEAQTLFLGAHYEGHLRQVREAGLAGVVRFEGNRPHVESVGQLLSARVLLLLEQNSDRGRLILPGKVWEYARAGRPILALVPPGGAADRLIRQLDAGRSVDPDRPDQVAAGIADLLARGSESGADRALLAPYERRALTAGFARVLERAAERR